MMKHALHDQGCKKLKLFTLKNEVKIATFCHRNIRRRFHRCYDSSVRPISELGNVCHGMQLKLIKTTQIAAITSQYSPVHPSGQEHRPEKGLHFDTTQADHDNGLQLMSYDSFFCCLKYAKRMQPMHAFATPGKMPC